MASSKFMSSRNSDLIRRTNNNNNNNNNHPATAGSTNNNSGTFQMTVDGPSSSSSPNNNQSQSQSQPQQTATCLDAATETVAAASSKKSVDDVWKELVAGRRCKQEVPDEMMTLEDFLAKAEAVEEEDVKIPPQPLPSGGIFSYDNPPNVNGIGGEEVGGRGKRRAILETLDKAAQQRQRRMIKNRESAARSRERKQAYQAELESLAVKLEEENEALMKVKTEQTRKRYKQLMDSIIPVTEKQRPRRCALRKVRSMEW